MTRFIVMFLLLVAPSAQAFDLSDLAIARATKLDCSQRDWSVKSRLVYRVKVEGSKKWHRAWDFIEEDLGDKVWIKSELKMPDRTVTTRMLTRKSDCEMLKLIVDGREVNVPEGRINRIEEAKAIRVRAGKFNAKKVLHSLGQADIVAYTSDSLPALGVAKQIIYGPDGKEVMVAELTNYSSGKAKRRRCWPFK